MTTRRYRYRSLADYLKRSGESQAALARRLQIAQAMISRYASGESMPRPELCERIARACDFPVESFIHEYLEYRQLRSA